MEGDEDKQVKDEICPCCGFEVNRKPIKFLESSSKLNFLGAGYPLLFNYYLYCVIILTVLFFSFGIFSLYSNFNGNFCIPATNQIISINSTDVHIARIIVSISKKPFNRLQNPFSNISNERLLIEEINYNLNETNLNESSLSNRTNQEKMKSVESSHTSKTCLLDWITIGSLANKLDNEQLNEVQNYFAIVTEIMIIAILMFFRRHQRKINNLVDEKTITPADYTIIVSGIPKNLKCNYALELKKIFEENLKTKTKYSVEKINLVYNTKGIKEIEQKLIKLVNQKKKKLIEFNFNEEIKEIKELNIEYEIMEKKLEDIKEHLVNTNEKFAGIAFISFANENGLY